MNKGIKILLYILATLFLGIPGPILVFIFIKIFEKKQDKKIKQELEAKERKEETPRKKEWEEDEKQVYLLAEKIILDINTQNGYPLRIRVFTDKLVLTLKNDEIKEFVFADYVENNMKQYYTWWCTDGTERAKVVNQQRLLADIINKSMSEVYDIHQKTIEKVDSIGSNKTMHWYGQEYVDMILE